MTCMDYIISDIINHKTDHIIEKVVHSLTFILNFNNSLHFEIISNIKYLYKKNYKTVVFN